MKQKKTKLIAIIILLIAWGSFSSAQQKDFPPACGVGMMPCLPECKIIKGTNICAADWVSAWQAARETCTNANSFAIQLVDRSGPSMQGLKVFESVGLKASGELLVITVKRPDKQEDSVIIIRAADVVRIEITKRPFMQE